MLRRFKTNNLGFWAHKIPIQPPHSCKSKQLLTTAFLKGVNLQLLPVWEPDQTTQFKSLKWYLKSFRLPIMTLRIKRKRLWSSSAKPKCRIIWKANKDKAVIWEAQWIWIRDNSNRHPQNREKETSLLSGQRQIYRQTPRWFMTPKCVIRQICKNRTSLKSIRKCLKFPTRYRLITKLPKQGKILNKRANNCQISLETLKLLLTANLFFLWNRYEDVRVWLTSWVIWR